MVVGAFLSPFGLSGSANPGNASDPLVTQSYVHLAIHQALAGIEQGSAASNQTPMFAPVQVLAGQVILGGEGAVLILRSGVAVANVPATDGIVNTTSGADLFNDHVVELNHYLIIPRADGRGVRALTDTWFLVKGEYQITQ